MTNLSLTALIAAGVFILAMVLLYIVNNRNS